MVTVTKNEILFALNKPDNFILALVRVPNAEGFAEGNVFKVSEKKGSYLVESEGWVVQYVHQPFQREPEVGVGSVNYHWKELWEKGDKPT